MNNELAIEILKQATFETTTGACEKCPRKDKNKTCIGCLDEAKDKALLEIERLNKLISQREKKWEKWTTEKTILSTRMSNYLCKYQNLKREYTKQIKISTDRKKEIERLGNELQVQIEDNTRLNEYIEEQDQKLQQKENIIKEVREYIDKYLEREYFDTDILENNTIYNRDLFKVKQILEKENKE